MAKKRAPAKPAKRSAPPALRVPKAVPKAIARKLRLPHAGAFLSYEKAYRLYDALEQERAATLKQQRQAVRKMERARTAPTQQKYMKQATAGRQKIGALDAARAKLETEVGMEPLPPMAGKDVRPVVHAEEFDDDYVVDDEGALEWEIGVDYTEEAGYTPRKGIRSEVSFNARLFRTDGRPMTESDARSAIDRFASNGVMPRGIEVRTVQWRTASGVERGTRRGESPVRDLQNFQSILMVVGDGGLRVGAVKPDTF